MIALALLALAAVPPPPTSTADWPGLTVDFPNTLVGVSSPDQQVFFTNDGPDPVDVSGVSIGGPTRRLRGHGGQLHRGHRRDRREL